VKVSNITALSRTDRQKSGVRMRVCSQARLLRLVLPIVVVGLTAGSALASPLGLIPAVAGGASAPVNTASPASAPVNTSLPTISGTAQAGKTLTASTGSWSGSTPMTYAYYWRRCDSSGNNCVVVSSTSSQTWALSSSDVGRTMRVGVTATNSAGSGWALSNATGVVQSSSGGTRIYWGA
jgi:hypothetical protein